MNLLTNKMHNLNVNIKCLHGILSKILVQYLSKCDVFAVEISSLQVNIKSIPKLSFFLPCKADVHVI